MTCPLPTRPGHVHSYLLPGAEGWTLVDTGIGLPDAAERWSEELARHDGPVARVLITHFHPDHVGAAVALRAAPHHRGPHVHGGVGGQPGQVSHEARARS